MQGSDTPAPSPSLPMEPPAWVPEDVIPLWQLAEAHPFTTAFLIVIVSYVLAKIVDFVIRRGLMRLAKKTVNDIDDKLIAYVQRPVFLTVFFGGMAIAVRTLDLPDVFIQTTIKILETLLVFAWLGAGIPVSRLLLEQLSKHRERFLIIEERTLPLFDIISKVLLFGGAAYPLLLIWGIDPTAWLTSAGVVGIAVGFAAKDTLANLFSGFFIIADAPYKIGDFIILESGERGKVTHVGIRSTRLETRDDIQITLPNAAIGNSKIINESGGKWEKERIRIKVGVAYGSDVDQVCAILEEVATHHEHICDSPSPRVRLRGFGDSSLDFELLCWIDEPVLRGKLSHLLYMEVYKVFAKEGVEIPYPKRDVYLHQVPALAGGDA